VSFSRGNELDYKGTKLVNSGLYSYIWSMGNKQPQVTVKIGGYGQSIQNWPDSSVNSGLSSPDSLYQRTLLNFKGSSFVLNLISPSTFEMASGYEDFRRRIDSADKATSSLVTEMAIFSRPYWEFFFKRIALVLPDSAVSLGSKWTVQEFVFTGDPIMLSAEYSVSGINNGIVTIKTEYLVEPKCWYGNGGMIFKGRGEGVIEVNAITGVVERINNHISVNGKMELGQIPMATNIQFQTIVELIKK
jgi:hypothetical protein